MERERPKGTGQGVPTSKGCWLALVKAWLQKIARRGMLGPLFQFLHKFFSWDPTAVPLWLLGTRSGALSPPDPLLHPAKKRLGVVTHSLLALLPSRFKRALECATAMAQRSVSAVGTKPSANPAGKGTKRKQDDLDLEEDQTWIESLQQELPDEDDPDDPSYEPVKSDTDSEEYRSQNSTEVDLEYEEKDGIIMLKEHQNPEGPPSEGNGAIGKPRPDADSKAEEPLFRTSGDGSENPRRQEPRGTRGRTLQGLILANGRSPEHEVPLRRQIQGSEATLNGNAQKQGLERADE